MNFLDELPIFCEEIRLAFNYAESLTEADFLPEEVKEEVREIADEIKVLRDFYGNTLLLDIREDGYESKVEEASQAYEDDLETLLLLLEALDAPLMLYGDGPSFDETKIICQQLFDL